MLDNQKLQLKIAIAKNKNAVKAKTLSITTKIDDLKAAYDEKTLARRAELEAELEALTQK